MKNLRDYRPNEQLYIPLGSMAPFVDNLHIPHTQMAREVNKLEKENYGSSMPEVMFDAASGKYLVISGYTTFYAYTELKRLNTLIPCKAFYEVGKDEKYLLTLDWMMKNNITNWYNRYNIITKLIIEFKYTETELVTFLQKQPKNIKRYLGPPANIINTAVRQGKENITNKVSLESFKNNHNKDYLYMLLLYFDMPITDDQLKFISWLRSRDINFEQCGLTLEQEHQLIDKALNLKEDFLAEIKEMINEMRINNGCAPIFTKD